jgi:hypothetical protein
MAARRTSSRSPVDVQVVSSGESLANVKPDIEVKTGLTEGKKYFIQVTPRTGRPVVIAVHL